MIQQPSHYRKTNNQTNRQTDNQTISKRRFLTWLEKGLPAALLLGSARTLNATPKSTRTLTILDTRIAGFAYYEGPALLTTIKPGDALTLRREPQNPHDTKAVEVYWQQHKIGYIPRRNNAAISRLMDDKEKIGAVVTLVKTDELWEPIMFDVMVRI